MAPDPVHVDQGLDVHLLDQTEMAAAGPLVVPGVGVLLPPHRLVGDVEGLEDLAVEVVTADQALGHVCQEQPRLGALDDPVVVGRRDGHRLADAEIGQGTGIGGLEPGRDPESPDADDETLTGQQAGHRLRPCPACPGWSG